MANKRPPQKEVNICTIGATNELNNVNRSILNKPVKIQALKVTKVPAIK